MREVMVSTSLEYQLETSLGIQDRMVLDHIDSFLTGIPNSRNACETNYQDETKPWSHLSDSVDRS